MALVQTCCIIGVLMGTAQPACNNVDQCGQGQYCQIGMRDRCVYCAEYTPLLRR
eukprot:COSAG01_NODE_657_length_14457_cov_99.379649_13_plen_54_part_00